MPTSIKLMWGMLRAMAGSRQFRRRNVYTTLIANFLKNEEDFFAFTYEWPITYATPASFASTRSANSFRISGSMSPFSLLGSSKCTRFFRPKLGDLTLSKDCKTTHVAQISKRVPSTEIVRNEDKKKKRVS